MSTHEILAKFIIGVVCLAAGLIVGFISGVLRYPLGDTTLGVRADEQHKRAERAEAKLRAARKLLEEK